jgi:hypothetical protein
VGEIVGVKMSEGPCDVGEAQPAGHATGAINVSAIIVTHPIEMGGLCENDPDQGGKGEDDENFCVFKLKRRLYTQVEGANRVARRALQAA